MAKQKAKPEKNKVGRPKAIDSPEQLAGFYKDYVEDVKNNPYLVHDFVGKDAFEVRKEKQRPLSWIGFECYLYEQGIIQDLDDYEKNTNNSYAEFQPIIRAIKNLIKRDQLEGATAGVYSQNIVARLLGLVEKKETDAKVKLESDIDYSKLSDEALEEIANAQRQSE